MNTNIWEKYPNIPAIHTLGCSSKTLWVTDNTSAGIEKALDSYGHLWKTSPPTAQFPITTQKQDATVYMLFAHEDKTALITDSDVAKYISLHETPFDLSNENPPWNITHVQNATIAATRNLKETETRCSAFASKLMTNLASNKPYTLNEAKERYDHHAIWIMQLANKIWNASQHTQKLMTAIYKDFPKKLILAAMRKNLAIGFPIPKGITIPTMRHGDIRLTEAHAVTIIPIGKNIYLIDNNGVCILGKERLITLLNDIAKTPYPKTCYLIHALKAPHQ